MKCFNGFCKEGVVQSETVGEILSMMGLRVKKEALDAIISEVDEDGKVISNTYSCKFKSKCYSLSLVTNKIIKEKFCNNYLPVAHLSPQSTPSCGLSRVHPMVHPNPASVLNPQQTWRWTWTDL